MLLRALQQQMCPADPECLKRNYTTCRVFCVRAGTTPTLGPGTARPANKKGQVTHKQATRHASRFSESHPPHVSRHMYVSTYITGKAQVICFNPLRGHLGQGLPGELGVKGRDSRSLPRHPPQAQAPETPELPVQDPCRFSASAALLPFCLNIPRQEHTQADLFNSK